MYFDSWDETCEYDAYMADAWNSVNGIYDEHVQALMNHAESTCSIEWECSYNECGNPVARLV